MRIRVRTACRSQANQHAQHKELLIFMKSKRRAPDAVPPADQKRQRTGLALAACNRCRQSKRKVRPGLFPLDPSTCADLETCSVTVRGQVARTASNATPSASTKPSVPRRVGRKLSNVSVRPYRRLNRLCGTALTGFGCRAKKLLCLVWRD